MHPKETFTFYSSETVDRIHDREYPRRNMQIPGPFFNKLNSFQLMIQNFGMPVAKTHPLQPVKKKISNPGKQHILYYPWQDWEDLIEIWPAQPAFGPQQPHPYAQDQMVSF